MIENNIYKKPKIVAEIGCNHMGDMALAKELIEMAKLSGADFAKFQKRNPKELLTEEQYNAPHPHPWNSFGQTYGAHREFLEFSADQHKELKEHCDKVGIGYTTSVWDITSARQIIPLNPAFIKVPSGCNNNLEMLKILRDEYRGDVHISLGMTTAKEEEAIIRLFEETNQAKNRLVLYSCTSGYPVKFEDVCLLEIRRLIDTYGSRVKEVGFSGHHLGIAIDNAAYMLGAQWIERHFTKDRTLKGTDHAASLEPYVFQKLVRDLAATLKSLTYKSSEILEVEKPQREKLKYQSATLEPRKKVVAFVPVKADSRAIPFKTVKDFCGRPLVYWNLAALQQASNVDEVYVFTNDQHIKNVVASFGFSKVRIHDEKERIGNDRPSTEDYLLEFINANPSFKDEDVLIFSQVTSPFTQAKDFESALKIYEEKKVDSLVTCARIRRFFWSEDGKSLNYDYTNRPRRQSFQGSLMENGAFYINNIENIKKGRNRLYGNIHVYEMPPFTHVELDEPHDWIIAEQYMKQYVLNQSSENTVKKFAQN